MTKNRRIYRTFLIDNEMGFGLLAQHVYDFIEYEAHYCHNPAAQDICEYALFHGLADAIARSIVAKRDDIILPSGNSIRFIVAQYGFQGSGAEAGLKRL